MWYSYIPLHLDSRPTIIYNSLWNESWAKTWDGPIGAGIASAGRDGDIFCSWLCCGDHWPSRWDEWGEIEMALVQNLGSTKKGQIPSCLTNFGAHVSKKVGTKHIWVHFLNPFLGANFEPLLLRQLPNFDCSLTFWPGDHNRSCALICWRVHLERFSFSRITSMIRSASVTATYPPGN